MQSFPVSFFVCIGPESMQVGTYPILKESGPKRKQTNKKTQSDARMK